MSGMKILHITDSHLYTDVSGRLKGVNTDASFLQVISAAAQHRDARLTVLGGDMAQDCMATTYQRMNQHFHHWSTAFLLSPGNHSNTQCIEDTLLGTLIQQKHWLQGYAFGSWQVISLNSSTLGQTHGELSDSELARLTRLLLTSHAAHILISIHHHPLPVGSAWLDKISLKNAEAFWSVVDASDKVRAVIHGHVHQEVDHWRGQVRVLGTPSTCIQFKPQQDDFALDEQSPGYRWLELSDDGTLSTGIERIEGHIADITDLADY